ncbi:MAG: B12-binding domain-containing radical SAM protein [Acidobacteria bacterium]|nr:B12-binding domain-containing radical SAM protein [Acidobacteriota bacterium]
MNSTESTTENKKLRVVLIKPSKYDDDGYVVRHFRGVLPSNTLACLSSLTRDVAERGQLGSGVEVQVKLYDDTVEKIPVRKIIKSNRLPECRTVVALAGVQSNQYPRAADLARKFRDGGLQVLLGGFHVSGTLALSPTTPREIQELIDIGVSIVKGEVEETWGALLRDAVEDNLKPVYDFLDKKPDLDNQPVPVIHRDYLKKFIVSNFGTIDCSRGCPFNCSFCSIINVQGKKMRVRSPESLARTIRENYRRHRINFYFFTDDNFARNGNWRKIFNLLIKLREENIPIQFMIQVDTQSHKIPDFIDLAARAGCTQVFIGMESINPQNLKAVGKTQNNVQNYRDLISTWHRAKIATHVAYIFGFPYDTPESIQEDVRRLQHELGVEQASFFMLTPIPGSQDHARMTRDGVYMDPDLNKYDSFHETVRHPNFAPGELASSYRRAWKDFYSFGYMKEVLSRANPENYWNIFHNFIWYKNSALIEGGHPMIHGFFRIKDRTDRRPGFPVESRFRHFLRRFREIRELARSWILLALEMEELWLQTRKRSEAEVRLLAEIKRIRLQVNRNLHSAELQLAHIRARIHSPELRVPSRLSLAFRNLNFRMAKRITYSRSDLKLFWKRKYSKRMSLMRPDRIVFNFLKDVQLLLLFVKDLARKTLEPSST